MVPKNSLIRLLGLAVVLAFLAPLVRADVKDGETYKCGSQGDVTVSVTPNGTTGDCTVTTTQAGTTSNSATGTPGATAGSCTESGSMTVPDGDGGPTTRVHDGKMQYKNSNGDWVDCGAPRKPKPKQPAGVDYLHAGEPAPHGGVLRAPGQLDWPMLTGDLAPWNGYLWGPGDDVTSLP